MYRSHVLVCGGTGCTSSNSQAIIEALETQIAEKGLSEEIKVIRTGCFGLCALGPIMIVYPEGSFYSQVKVEEALEKIRKANKAEEDFNSSSDEDWGDVSDDDDEAWD